MSFELITFNSEKKAEENYEMWLKKFDGRVNETEGTKEIRNHGSQNVCIKCVWLENRGNQNGSSRKAVLNYLMDERGFRFFLHHCIWLDLFQFCDFLCKNVLLLISMRTSEFVLLLQLINAIFQLVSNDGDVDDEMVHWAFGHKHKFIPRAIVWRK